MHAESMKTLTQDYTNQDPELFSCIKRERARQENHLELIASENITSEAVLAAQGSVLTNKYAEGYVGRRYYGGCEYVDEAEKLAQERVKKLFGCEFANVQPHSGSSANLAVFFALLKPGDTFMGLSLNQGGHLTHGAPVNFSGKWFHAIPYGVDKETECIDMDQVRDIALKHRPKMIIAGTTAYPRTLDFARFRAIADEVGAYLLADIAHIAGLIATKRHPSPFPHAHVVTSTTHKTLRGPRGGVILTNDAPLAKKINTAIIPGLQGGPLMHVIAAKAVAFGEALTPSFATYIHQVQKNAHALGEALQQGGLRLITGGTDNHLLVADVTSFNLSGAEAEKLLESVGIVCNKNTIPGETRSPMEASGIRLGTPACTTRGFKEKDFEMVGTLVATTLKNESPATLDNVRKKVLALSAAHPLPYSF